MEKAWTRRRPLGARRINRRDFLKIGGAGIAGAALLGVAGCGSEGGGGQQGGGGGGGGNNLVVGYDQEPAILNGFIVGGDLVATADMTAGILQTVLQYQPDFTYAPLLAEADPEIVSEEPFTIEYKLKEGLTWSDGEPLTSDDAKFTYDQIMNPDNQIITREVWDKIETFETPDERTVRITFREPDARWRDTLGDPSYAILPRHVYEGKDFNTALNDEVVGSGPFQLREWRKGESLTLERNPNYWGEEPALESVTFRFIPDTNSLVTALQSGEVQFITPPPDIGLIERMEGFEGVTVDTKFGTEWEHLAFNLEKVDNLQLRQAIAYGIDRDQLVNEILPGDARKFDSVIVPELGDYYEPAWEKYAFDQDRARELAQEAEAAGANMTVEFSTTSGNALRETLQQIIQQQLGEIGITVETRNSAPEEYFGERMPNGDFEVGDFAWSASPDPSITTLFAADQLPPEGQNYYRYVNEEVTRLMQQSDATVDEAERAELLRQVQTIMADDLPLIPIFQRPNIYAFSEGLQGPENNPTEAGAFWNIGEWSLQG